MTRILFCWRCRWRGRRCRSAAVTAAGQSKPASFFTCDQGMRGFLPCALFARSIVRASSTSSTVWRIWRIRDLAWVNCLSNWFQAACGLVGIAIVLLINVLPVAHIINDNRPAFQFKKDAVISSAQAVFVFETLELLDIRRQVILQPVNFPANQTPHVLG